MNRLIIILLCFLSFKIHAQTGFGFIHLSVEDKMGLNSDAVLTTYQDNKGFIWIGTANGLQRFDGSKFINLYSSNFSTDKMPVSDLVTILPYNQTELILHFGSKNEVGIFNPSSHRYKKINMLPNNPLPARKNTRLWKDYNNNYYFTVYRYGILKYDTIRQAFTDFDGFGIPKGWMPDVYSFEDTITGRIWFPCPDSGLVLYDKKTNTSYNQKHNPIQHPILKLKEIYPGTAEFFIDSKRRYWIFNWTNMHFRRCYNERGQLLNDTAGLYQNNGYTELRYFFESKNGTLWMYGANCLFTSDERSGKFIFTPGNNEIKEEIHYNSIYHIMEDKEGGIWIATDQGIYFMAPTGSTWDIVNMKFKKKPANYEFTDVLQLKTGEYWITSWGSGVVTLNKNLEKYDAGIYQKFTTNNWQFYDQTWCLYQDDAENVWIGCQFGKYIVYNPATKTSSFEVLKEAENATIRYITGTNDHAIFLGTQRGHLIKYQNKVFTTVQKFKSIIRKILIDKEGLIWVATEGDGLYCTTNNGNTILKHYTTENGSESLFINSCLDLEQLNDSVIICAAGALNFINKRTHQVKWITVDEGLPSNTLMRMRKDHNGYIWMITKNGLCRYNPLNERISVYGKKDGIVLANITTEADYLANDNTLVFAGGSGALFFKPDVFKLNQKPPDVVITDIAVSGKNMIVDSLLRLPYIRLSSYQNSITFNFSVLSFLNSDKLTYHYRLLGIDNDWTKISGSHTVNFNLLPPGKYEFEIYSETIDGIKSEKITRIQFHITPPFWRTGWFLSALVTIIIFIAYAMHRLRIKKILAVEKIRNRVARDLHDDMGSTLSTINILSSMAKAKLNTDNIKTGEYINKISDNAQRMMEAMDDIVWAIKPANDSMHKVVGRMREFATNVFEAKDIELHFEAEEAVNDVKISMEARRDFFLIFKEAVNNAAKYSKCDKAEVYIIVKNKKLILLVKDNGIGFDVKTADSGNGLSNMQKRADSLKAKFSIESTAQKGTEVQLVLPLIN